MKLNMLITACLLMSTIAYAADQKIIPDNDLHKNTAQSLKTKKFNITIPLPPLDLPKIVHHPIPLSETCLYQIDSSIKGLKFNNIFSTSDFRFTDVYSASKKSKTEGYHYLITSSSKTLNIHLYNQTSSNGELSETEERWNIELPDYDKTTNTSGKRIYNSEDVNIQVSFLSCKKP